MPGCVTEWSVTNIRPPVRVLTFPSVELVAIVGLTGLLTLTAVALLASRLQLRSARRQVAALETEFVASGGSRGRRVAGMAVKAVVETTTRVRESGLGGFLVSSIEDITRWVTEDRAAIERIAAADGTVTIFFSDIESSTIHNERLGDGEWVRVLEVHDRIAREQIRRHRGHVVKTHGDGFMVVFREPAEGVRAALDIQRELNAAAASELRHTPIKDRIGVHVGAVVTRRGDYFGRNVAMAARVAGQAAGGQVIVSDDVRRCLGQMADARSEFDLKQGPRTDLKGLSGVHQLWWVNSA